MSKPIRAVLAGLLLPACVFMVTPAPVRAQTPGPLLTAQAYGDQLTNALVGTTPATFGARRQVGATSLSPVPIRIRLGVLLSPRLKFDGGVDFTLSGVHLLPSCSTRIDADAIISANFGGLSTLIPITFDQVYSRGVITGNRLYVGGGIGPYIGNVTRLGGKVFAGVDLTSHIGIEATVHFAGVGDTLFAVQARLGG